MYIETEKEVSCRVDQFWDLISDFANQSNYLTSVTNATGEGKGVGSVCTCDVNGRLVREVCVFLDPISFVMVYTATVEGDSSLYDYIATVRMKFLTPSRTLVHWSANFKMADGVEAQVIQDFSEECITLYRLCIDDFENYVFKHTI